MRAISIVRRVVLALALPIILFAESAAFGQTRYAIDQPAQPLADAIRSIGKKSGMNILFDPAVTSGKVAQPVKGEYTAEEAIARALSGTDLVAEKVQEGTISIRPRSRPSEMRLGLHDRNRRRRSRRSK